MSAGSTEVEIWERVIHPRGTMSRETARRILKLSFSSEEQERMQVLAERSRSGRLSVDDEARLDEYCRAGSLLSILKSRARQVLKGTRRTS